MKEYYYICWHEHGDEDCMSTSHEFKTIEKLNIYLEEISPRCDYIISCEVRQELKVVEKSFKARG